MRIRYQILLLSIAVLGVYYPAIFAPLNSVDDPGLYQYLLNADDFSLTGIFFPGSSGGYYRPILQISFIFDKYVWGLEQSFMHLDNILLHLCNTLLVFALARKVCRVNNWTTGGAFTAALLFAVHPINTESVSWISGRTDPLAALFLLLSALALLYRHRPLLSTLAAALLMLLACLVKETAIFFLPAAFCFPFYLREEKEGSLRERALANLPHFAVFLACGAGYFGFRAIAFSKGDEGLARVATSMVGKQSPDFLLRVRLGLKTVGFYGKKLVEPFPLNFAITHVSEIYVLVGILVGVALCFLVLRRTLLSFFWASAASIAASGIVIGFLNTTWTPLAERYMYIPSAFFLIALTLSLQQSKVLRLQRKYQVAFIVPLVTIAIWGSFTRNLLWQDNLAFFQDTVRKTPDFTPARNELAIALKGQGRTQEALEIYKTFELQTELKNAQYGMLNKAGAFADSGDFQTARTILREVLKTPGKQEIQILERMLEIDKLAMYQGKTTQALVYDDSVACLKRLSELTGNPFYQYRLGVVHLQAKNEPQALAAFKNVSRTAASDVYYRKPAEKLVAKLEAKAGAGVTGGDSTR
jgi:protein O-mannosyl-transferase